MVWYSGMVVSSLNILGDILHRDMCSLLSSQWGDMLSSQWGDMLSSQWGDMLSSQQGDMLSSQQGGMLSSQQGDMLSSQQGGMLSSQQGDMLSSQQGDMLSSQQGDMLSSQQGTCYHVIFSTAFRSPTSYSHHHLLLCDALYSGISMEPSNASQHNMLIPTLSNSKYYQFFNLC